MSKAVICLSPKIGQNLIKRGVEKNKCIVVPNAIDVSSLQNQFRAIKQDFHLPEFDLLFVGRLENRKGLLWLLRSLILLNQRGKRFTLKVVGHGPLRKEIELLISTHNMNPYVEIMGYVSRKELCKLFLSSRCVVIPSLYEGVPGVALEAMVAGKPIIASNIPGLGEIVKDRVNGLIVNPLDVEGLALAIQEVLEKPVFSKSLDKINTGLLAEFDWDFVAKEIVNVYSRCTI